MSVPEVSRDSVVAVYVDKGEDAKCGYKDVNEMKKQVLMTSYEDDEVGREGIEFEKTRFQALYKNQPDVLKKARFHPERVQNKQGKWVIELRTRVYDRAEG